MPKKQTVEKTPEEQTEQVAEAPAKKGKGYDVVDIKGRLLNIYEDKEVAEVFAGKVAGRTVVASPAGRTREDVKEAGRKAKAERLEQLQESNPGHYEPK